MAVSLSLFTALLLLFAAVLFPAMVDAVYYFSTATGKAMFEG